MIVSFKETKMVLVLLILLVTITGCSAKMPVSSMLIDFVKKEFN